MKTRSNPINVAAKEKVLREAREKYLRVKLILILTGTILFVIGAGAFAFERARIEGGKTETELVEAAAATDLHVETESDDKQSRLAYLYNTLPMVGAAILGALAFHSRAKRNQEIDRIADIDEQLEQIRILRVDLLTEIEGEDNDYSHVRQSITRDHQVLRRSPAGYIPFSGIERGGTTGDSDRNRSNG